MLPSCVQPSRVNLPMVNSIQESSDIKYTIPSRNSIYLPKRASSHRANHPRVMEKPTAASQAPNLNGLGGMKNDRNCPVVNKEGNTDHVCSLLYTRPLKLLTGISVSKIGYNLGGTGSCSSQQNECERSSGCNLHYYGREPLGF
jgi:hypothetical protein